MVSHFLAILSNQMRMVAMQAISGNNRNRFALYAAVTSRENAKLTKNTCPKRDFDMMVSIGYDWFLVIQKTTLGINFNYTG
jgi:hypothetical protein